MRLRRVTFHMAIYGISPISPILKIKHYFLDNTITFITDGIDLGFSTSRTALLSQLKPNVKVEWSLQVFLHETYAKSAS